MSKFLYDNDRAMTDNIFEFSSKTAKLKIMTKSILSLIKFKVIFWKLAVHHK